MWWTDCTPGFPTFSCLSNEIFSTLCCWWICFGVQLLREPPRSQTGVSGVKKLPWSLRGPGGLIAESVWDPKQLCGILRQAHAESPSAGEDLLTPASSVTSDALCPMGCSLPGSSVHGILQARILEGVAIPFSRGSSWAGDLTCISCKGGGFFTTSATWEFLHSRDSSLVPWGPPQELNPSADPPGTC